MRTIFLTPATVYRLLPFHATTDTNSLQNYISAFLTSGVNCQNWFNIGLGPASSFRCIAGAGAESTTATSISLSAKCDSPPCCAVVWCFGASRTSSSSCTSLRYNLHWSIPESAALAAWAVAVIVVVALIVVGVVAGVLVRARRMKQAQAQQTGTVTTTIVMQPQMAQMGGPAAAVPAWGQPQQVQQYAPQQPGNVQMAPNAAAAPWQPQQPGSVQ